MNFRKIVAHLAYSPAMIWHLAAYDTKIKLNRTKNLRIILFAILNLIIIATALSINNDHQLSLFNHNLQTASIATSLSNQPLINSEAKINNFSSNIFFNDINSNTQLVQTYQYFKINLNSVQQLRLINSPDSFNNCREINYSPINNIGQISINDNLTAYIHHCQKQYYGLAIAGHNQNDFVILNNGNLLVNSDIVTNTTDDLSYNISVVNLTTNTPEPAAVRANQSIKYTIVATNTSEQTFNGVVKINLNDIAEYSHILNNSLNSDQSIYWQIDNLRSRQSTTYEVYAKTNQQFNHQPINTNSPTHHDCQISLGIGSTTVTTPVICSYHKRAEIFIYNNFNPTSHDSKVLIALILLLLIIIVLKILHIARINFVSKEIRIIRHKINQGII